MIKSQQSGEIWIFTAGIHKNTKFQNIHGKKWMVCIVNSEVTDNIPCREFLPEPHYGQQVHIIRF